IGEVLRCYTLSARRSQHVLHCVVSEPWARGQEVRRFKRHATICASSQSDVLGGTHTNLARIQKIDESNLTVLEAWCDPSHYGVAVNEAHASLGRSTQRPGNDEVVRRQALHVDVCRILTVRECPAWIEFKELTDRGCLTILGWCVECD